jgi:hypothetical protein
VHCDDTSGPIGARFKMNAERIFAPFAESLQVFGPFDKGDAVSLSLINHSRTQGIASNREAVGIDMPNGQIATVLGDEDERWRCEFRFCV